MGENSPQNVKYSIFGETIILSIDDEKSWFWCFFEKIPIWWKMGVGATLAPDGLGPQDPTKNGPTGWTCWVNCYLKNLNFQNFWAWNYLKISLHAHGIYVWISEVKNLDNFHLVKLSDFFGSPFSELPTILIGLR